MSKAFTREDDLVEQPIPLRPANLLPPGVKNYITADGAKRLEEELDRMVQEEKPRLLASGSSSLPALEQRIANLSQSLQSVVVVDLPKAPPEQVRFGAFVTVRDQKGNEAQYRIVGVDETDLDRGWVSWRSPIARALLNSAAGDKVRLQLPGGAEELEIIKISFQAAA